LLVGGGQENTLRAGTENTAAIVGFGKAAEIARQELSDRSSYYLKLRKLLEQELKTIPSLVIFAEQVERLPNTVQFGIKNIDGEMLLMQLDQKNIAVSSGSACSSGGGKASSVLVAMGVEFSVAKSAIRVSLGKMNTEVEIMKFIKILKSIVTTSRA
jgi:cysteine desulfurase